MKSSRLIPVAFIYLSILCLNLATSHSAWAWGELGHQTVAEIAEKILELENDMQTKKAVRAVLGVEPFAVASVWPDQVRSDERFGDFAPYHFVTIYRNPKQHSDKSAMTVLQKYPQVLTDPKAPREAKMLALRYIIHVVGDIHQPLHIGNEFDRGGNSCQVFWRPYPSGGDCKAEKPPKATNLHTVWDKDMVEELAYRLKKNAKILVKYFGYKEVAQELMSRHADLIRAESGKIDIDGWVQSSRQLRESQVYPDKLADDTRPYCQNGKDSMACEDIPVLDGKYIEAKMPIVERQLVLGGVHLAALLKQMLSQSKSRVLDEEKILQMLKLTNED